MKLSIKQNSKEKPAFTKIVLMNGELEVYTISKIPVEELSEYTKKVQVLLDRMNVNEKGAASMMSVVQSISQSCSFDKFNSMVCRFFGKEQAVLESKTEVPKAIPKAIPREVAVQTQKTVVPKVEEIDSVIETPIEVPEVAKKAEPRKQKHATVIPPKEVEVVQIQEPKEEVLLDDTDNNDDDMANFDDMLKNFEANNFI